MLFLCRNAFHEVLLMKEYKLRRSKSLYAMCIIIVSFVCFFSSVSNAGSWVELTHDDFEAGWGSYTPDGGPDCSLYESGTHAVGTNSANIQGDTGTPGSFKHTNGIDVHSPSYTQIKVDFWFKMVGMESGEGFWVQYYNGSGWQNIGTYNVDVYGNDAPQPNTIITLNEGTYNFPTNMKIRFKCDASSNGDDIYIDEIIVSGWVDVDDFTPPTPNPATFSTAPNAASATSISMTATTGTDTSGPVEYSFVETSGNPGASNSGWTTSSTYTDTGLSEGTTYTYTVQMQDNSAMGTNTGTASSGFSATTLVTVPDATSLAQATAEANVISAGLAVGSITRSFSNTTVVGSVISQIPAAGTALALGSAVNLNVSKGIPGADFEDLMVFAANWLDTDCGICNDLDYSGDNDVDIEDYAFFAQKWLLEPPKTLVINEFMASNDSVLENPDEAGEFPDWIEIYNYGDEVVIMDDMFLADSANTYLIPFGVSIYPKEYKLFYADDEPEQGPLHTNFKLGASGDDIKLYDTDGVSLIDSITYKATQQTDISHGRYPDNTPDWYNMDDPSPGLTNLAGMAGEVWFSKLSGTFTSTFDLELSTESPTAEIRYTTQGSMPTAASTLYTGPISISTSATAIIRARAFEPAAGLAPGPVTGHYYIALAADAQGFTSNLPIVVIDTYAQTLNKNLKVVSSVFVDTDKNTGLANIEDVPNYAGRSGLRRRGESSDVWPKKHYGLELWDENNIDIKASLFGMPSESDWTLNNPYGDKALIRNVLAYKWANDIGQGFAAPGTKLVEIFVNEGGGNCSYSDYRGVYVLTEKIKVSENRLDIGNLGPSDNTEPEISGGYILRLDKPNGQEYFYTTADMLRDGWGGGFQYYDPEGAALTGTQKGWILNHLNEYETVLNSGNFNDPVNGYAKFIDTESFIEQDLIAELFKEADNFAFSTYLYKEKNGKIAFGPQWDLNFSSGNATNSGWGYPEYFSRADTSEGWFNYYRNAYGWHRRLLEDFEYKLGMADKWFEHREDKLSDAKVSADIDYYYTLLDSDGPLIDTDSTPVDRNFAKWNILNTYQWCNYYYGYNWSRAEQGNLPHTYKMETEWLKNWFNGQGTPAAGEWYLTTHSDRLGHLDALWASDRNIAAPPALLINSAPMDTGGSISVGSNLVIIDPNNSPGTIYYTLDGTDPRAAFTGNAVGTAYSGDITLNETTQVKARIKDDSNWSALNEAVFSDDRVANSLRITEIMYHPVDPNDEFIEFKNIGASTINLAHCQLTQGVNFTFPSMTLAPNDYVIVVRNQIHFALTYPSYSGAIAGEYTNDKLDNGGENIRLKDAAGIIIQEFDYEDGWFPITDGMGFSLNIIDPTDANLDNWNKRLSWEASNVLGGTPGQNHIANTVGNADIVINEILTHTDNPEGDWIELYNTTGSSVNIGNWYLSDDKDNLKKYRIASPTNIPAGGYLVLTAATHFGNGADSGSLVQFGLSEHGEEVFLTSGNGTDIAGGYSDGESFGSSRNDVTFGRYTKGAPTFNTDFIELISMTQGAANSAPYVPDVVITEIMYNAQDLPDLLGEYIELHNRDIGTVYLYDLANPDNTWKFTKGIDYTFPTGVSIGAGQKILISRTHPDAFKIANGDPGVPVYGPFASGTELENDGEKIELSMPTDPDPGTGFFSYIRVEQVNYSDGMYPQGVDLLDFAANWLNTGCGICNGQDFSGDSDVDLEDYAFLAKKWLLESYDPWPTSADGRGDSLHRTTLSNYGNDVANWSAAAPTPGS